MKKLYSLILSAAFLLLAACASADAGVQPQTSGAESAVSLSETITEAAKTFEHEGFYVSGTSLYDAAGSEFIMRGVNHAHTWFKGELNAALTAIAETGANTVRIVLSDGGEWSKDRKSDVSRIIKKCKELHMIVALEVHDATGSNDSADLMKAVDYWIEIKDELIGNEPYVLINIANEWYGDWKSEGWRDGYLEAIPKLRDAGIRNTIIVDSAGWGQYPESVFKYGREVFEADELANTIFSIHMYENAGKNEETVKRNIDSALEIGVPVIIGEFGHKHTGGAVAYETILSYCNEKGIGYMGWSWKGNSGGVEYLDIAVEWDGSVLSDDWGEPLINSEYGIKATSEKCAVFE